MGFCRRCGDIVVGPRCKCGGSAVAPVVKWPDGQDEPIEDRWSKTYVTKAETSTRISETPPPLSSSSTGAPAARRFPRPTVSTSISNRVSAHIASATTSRPSSPLKHSSILSQPDEVKAKEGILPSPHGSELAKVYGSVLQPKETLASFACAICATPFPPDATIYPDPSHSDDSNGNSAQIGTRFLCRACFIKNGGSRGDCPTCNRPVLILKSEGGFVESVGQVWHKKCFICDGCGRNIGDHPMVDLLSRPCCADCFDSCLKRPVNDHSQTPQRRDPIANHPSGSRKEPKDREMSPAMDELEKRLGITKKSSRVFVQELQSESEAKKVYPTTPRYSNTSLSDSDSRTSVSHYSKVQRNKPPLDSPVESSASEGRYKSPEPDIDSSVEHGSPSLRRYSQVKHRSLDTEDESPSIRRTHRSSTSRESLTSSAAGVGTSSRSQPSEEAIEEMKRRFLTGSPAATPTKPASPSNSSTPRRRRSKSRSRSRPRASDASFTSSSSPLLDESKKARTLRSTASTSSLRSALRSQRAGTKDLEDASPSYLNDVGESTKPLRIMRQDRTGDSQGPLKADLTGATSYLAQSTLDGFEPVRPQKTGEVVYGIGAIDAQNTGVTVQTHKTGDTDYTMLASQITGDTSYTKTRPLRHQRTGDGIGSQNTGYALFPPIRPQKTGDKTPSKSSRRESREGTLHADVRTNRTGDAEVASLLGEDDLIDLHGRIPLTGAYSNGLMSKIPIPTARSSPHRESATGTLIPHTSESYESTVSSIPDLTSDLSDATSGLSSSPSTPPSLSPPPRFSKGSGSIWSGSYTHNGAVSQSRTLPASITIPENVPADAGCEKCKEPLFNIKHGGKFVTVPEEPTSTGAPPRRYHTACFKCKVCGEIFEEKEGGHAVFVRVEEGACHVRCAPPEKITLRKVPASSMPKLPSKLPVANTSSGAAATSTAYYQSSSRYERPLPTAPAVTNTSSTPQARFGGSAACPGCHKAVSPMERGVVPGPQGTRWHMGCLICGGESAKGRRKESGKAGCGKKLDSAAKVDAEGGVWCRECLLLLPLELRQARSPVVATSTGTRPTSMVAPQFTGATTLARQCTGLGLGGDSSVLKQTTGGGWTPSKTATKLYDGPRPGRIYPRPKSVTGTRSTDGEGRGMFLIRQLTGGNTSFSGNEYGL